VDLRARLDRRHTLHCEHCHRRIAWTTFRLAFRSYEVAWRWQGKGVPIRYRIDGDTPVIDLECLSCGWQATYPVWEIELAAKVLMAKNVLLGESHVAAS
jgi:hypothetical protein